MKPLFFTILIFINLTCPTFSDNCNVFPVSTEMQIGRIKNFLDRAPKGIYLTVGGERAFRGASMFEGIDYLIIVDISPEIVRYNTINLQLLKAPNKEDYKHLRWKATLSEWQKISGTLTEDDLKWWDENVRNIKKGYDLPESLNQTGSLNRFMKVRQKLMDVYPQISKKFNNYEKMYLSNVSWSDIEPLLPNAKDPITKEDFEWFNEQRKFPNSCIQKQIDDSFQGLDWAQIIDYKSGNYLFDDKLYQRLHQLVVDQKVKITQADLSKPADVDGVVSTINLLKSNLAVLDMNNLYRYGYIGEDKFRMALSKLLECGTKDSILILMSNYKDYACAQFSVYVGFTFENVKRWPVEPFFEAFIENFPNDLLPLLDGRLYEGTDELPLYLKKS